MTASTSHEGGQHFLRRARHFARRELLEHRGMVPVSVGMLSHFLLYRAGVSAAQIAAWEEERREALLPDFLKHSSVITPQDAADWATVTPYDVARQLMACMALLGTGGHHVHMDALCDEMGRINFEPREAELYRFPGPSRLSHHITEAAS